MTSHCDTFGCSLPAELIGYCISIQLECVHTVTAWYLTAPLGVSKENNEEGLQQDCI